ncbi:MAG: ribosome maturation factor RimM [Eubacteriaceae bacterium]|nr:ribosome maturation factor RimM [Eubacteriaceae bacterium]
MKETIVVGRLSRPHGLKGELSVAPLTDDVDRFFKMGYFICEGVEYSIQNVRIHKGQALLTTNQITTRTQAELMKGKYIEVLREDAVELNEGEYFIEDMKGLEVRGTGGRTGILVDVMQTGAVDILIIEIDGKQAMLPFLNRDVSEVNIKDGYIKADLDKLFY